MEQRDLAGEEGREATVCPACGGHPSWRGRHELGITDLALGRG